MSPLESLAVLASLVSVWLSVRRHIGTWPSGMLGVAAYFVVFLEARLYADMALQVLFFVQCAYGWWQWQRDEHPGAARVEPPIRVLSARARLAVAAAVTAVSLGVGTLLARHTDAAGPYWDAAASTLSITANQLLAKRYLDNWVLWIVADALYVGIFCWKRLFLSAALYLLFFGMVIAGLLRWTRQRRADLAAAGAPAAQAA